MSLYSRFLAGIAAWLAVAPVFVLAADIGTAFTYQGYLEDGSGPVTDVMDFRFRMYDAATLGNLIGGMEIHDGVTNPAINVVDGLFSVVLDFEQSIVVDQALWLEIEVRPDGPPVVGYTTLQPRVEVTPAPRALWATQATQAALATQATRAVEGVGPPNMLEVDSVNSRIGIGTSTPGALLEVAGEIRSTSANGGQLTTYNPNNQSASVHLSWLDDVARIRIGGSGAGALNGLDIQGQGDSSKLRILNNGNVGIGMTTPESSLHVGTGDGTLLKLGNDPELIFTRDIANGKFNINLGGTGYNGRVLQIGRDDGNHDIGMTGNVGIGTNSPSAKLHVAGTAGVDGIMFPDGTLQTSAVKVLRTSHVQDLASIASGGFATVTATVAGATVGSVAYCSPSSLDNDLGIVMVRVSAANIVQVRVQNFSASPINPPSITWEIAVIP